MINNIIYTVSPVVSCGRQVSRRSLPGHISPSSSLQRLLLSLLRLEVVPGECGYNVVLWTLAQQFRLLHRPLLPVQHQSNQHEDHHQHNHTANAHQDDEAKSTGNISLQVGRRYWELVGGLLAPEQRHVLVCERWTKDKLNDVV